MNTTQNQAAFCLPGYEASADVFGHATACPETPYVINCDGSENPWAVTAYCGQTSFFGGTPILSQGAGYGIVLGFGLFFSIFTTFLVWLDSKFAGTVYDSSEQFNTAGRTVKTGLTASVIVSQWTWAATLLQSSNVAYAYGVSGPFWYASGATIQILLFGIIAIEIKRKAPTAHTVTEIVLARWGRTAHKVFLFFALCCNIIVTSMLLLGGAAVVNALTGMDINAAAFLIPIGVILYTWSGGLKATFLASYIHTAVIMIILLSFVCVVYISSPDLGSPDKVYNNLMGISKLFPVEGNKEGAYATMLSSGGLMFGIINIVGNFGTVFLDQAYWQSAIAARPSAATKGYLLGGFVWFTIPFALATSLGLSTVALDLPVTPSEAGQGLVPPAAAVYFWGQGGAYAILIMLFMAVTSTGSAELIAVSSLFVYDIYRVYINPQATGKQIMWWSRAVILIFGLFMGCFALILQAIGLNLGWVYLFMGVVIGSAVVPISYLLLWSKCSAKGAMSGAIIGFVAALASWIGSAVAYYGEVSVASLGNNEPMLIGNLVAILGSGLICTVVSLMDPDDFDFEATRNIALVENQMPPQEESDADLFKAKKNIVYFGVGFTLLIVVLWPVLSVPAGVFTKGYFSFWVIISIVWAFVATTVIVLMPPFESSADIMAVLSNCFTCTEAEQVAPAQYKSQDSPSEASDVSEDFGSESGGTSVHGATSIGLV